MHKSPDSIAAPPPDVIIVGAGTAGCVLAARLSEDAALRVWLIEAGPDLPPGREPRDIRDPYPVAMANPRFVWRGLEAASGPACADGTSQAVPFIQACCVGGASNINGMFAERGFPEDYDEWQALGAGHWGWNDVLPYFRKLEADAQGPIPIERIVPARWSAFAAAFARALDARGYPTLTGDAATSTYGVSPAAMNCRSDQRVSVSMAYLTEAVRRRPNLTIVANASVDRIVFHDRVVRGVDLRTERGPVHVAGRQVIVACGALFSPALLLRSGIGPAQQLMAQGLPVIHSLPGVGENLQNHPMVPLVTHLRPAGRQPRWQRLWAQNVFRYSSHLQGCAGHDMQMIPMNRASWHPLGRRVASMLVIVNKPYSRGAVRLKTAGPDAYPSVTFNLLQDTRDFDRLVHGVRLAAELLADADMAPLHNGAFLPDGRLVGRLARRTWRNGLRAALIGLATDIGPLRRRGLRRSALDLRSLARDEGAIRDLVRATAQAAFHPCGSCRMGGASDGQAVVDAGCRVHGVAGLRVIDASVFPTIPRAGTHVPVLMVAEVMADRLRAEWRHARSGPP